MSETVSVEVLHEVVYSFIDEKMGKVTITQRVTQERLASLLTDKNITLISVDKPPKAYSFKKRRKR
jgi:type IV secretory pathway VirD2 relaxase